MLSEAQIEEEIKKLEQTKLQLMAQYNQIEGALATFNIMLNPGPEFDMPVEEVSVE